MTLKNFLTGWLCPPLFLMSTLASARAQVSAPVDQAGKPGLFTFASQHAAKVDAILSEWDKPDSPGCVVGVIQAGELVYHHGFGLANFKHGAPITGRTVFDVASMSKQFTAMAILLLASDGMLTIEDDVRRFIPQLPVYFEDTPIRSRHLLGHTSGLRDYLGMLQFMGIDKRKDFFGTSCPNRRRLRRLGRKHAILCDAREPIKDATVDDAGKPGSSTSARQQAAKVAALFSEWDKPDSPGCVVGVIKEGKFAYKRGFGMANLEHEVPISPQSAFYIASTSKQFTAMAVFLLAKEGKVSLDIDIRVYVPELPMYEQPVTIRHLMHHTSGVRDYLMLKQYAGIRDYLSNEDTLALIARQKELNFTPGSRSAYSNSGYWLLALIVERQSGMSLATYAKKHIFEPLGMIHTRFHEYPHDIIQGRVRGYARRDNGGFEIKDSSRQQVGPGGVVTTLTDLLLWDRNFYEARVGGEEIIQQMVTPDRFNNGRSGREAAGLIVDRYRGQVILEHSGRGRGFNCQMVRFPEKHFTVMVLCNLQHAPADRRCFDIADIFLADQFPTVPTKRSEPSPGNDPSVVVAVGKLKALTGQYVEGGDVFEIAFADGSLTATMNALITRPLVPYGRNRFRVEGRAWTLEFSLKGDAKPDSLALEINGDPNPMIFRVPHTLSVLEAHDFIGQYRSEELDVTYQVLFETGHLLIRFNDPSKCEVFPDPLIRLKGDSFMDGSMTQIRFLRGRHNVVTGLRIDDPRVSNICFFRLGLSGEDSTQRGPSTPIQKP